ncbi:hypothetical protein K491DRAFT_711755 [Lophiostoma macrostomum CBS 122681]|uniref:Uncharacterized protein n=1 Tax=Lophiostoma macrostomum CBS 122681 TaxID=1314788 RepID=A0A6A6TM78_9PLEO|nr:hypothetical protein K491DRAFT_711755 [Lophiostoma macrostomum CBS 122681]
MVTETQICYSCPYLYEEPPFISIPVHRSPTILDADQFSVPDRGRTTEHGTHKRLLTFDGVYHRSWDLHDVPAKLGSSSQRYGPKRIHTCRLHAAFVDKDPFPDILQMDGQSDSKPSGLRGRFRRHRLDSIVKKQQQEEEKEEEILKANEEAGDDSIPFQVISPRPTEVSTPEVRPRHSFSLKRRSRDHRSGSSGGRASLPRDEDVETTAAPTQVPNNGDLDETISPTALTQAIEQKVLKHESFPRPTETLTQNRDIGTKSHVDDLQTRNS